MSINLITATCALCNGELEKMIKFTPTPPANELYKTPILYPDVFPLNFCKCKKCEHLQLDFEIPRTRLFNNYTYVSDTGNSNREHFKEYANKMIDKFKPSFVVDIGSNDGLFLSNFKDCEVLGVDPAANIEKKVKTLINFFDEQVADTIISTYGKPDLITCNNAFAHNKNLTGICKGVKKLLKAGGTFVIEVSYAMDLLENQLFDLIYHEHYHHWRLYPLIKFMKNFGLHVVDAERIKETHGGSIRVYFQHTNRKENKKNFTTLLANEKLYFDKLLENFVKITLEIKLNIEKYLKEIKINKRKLSIIGYPAKACTLTYFYGLDKSVIDSVYDDNYYKIGKYTPLNFKIKPTSAIYDDHPEILLILAWNYTDQIINSHKNYKGRWMGINAVSENKIAKYYNSINK